LIKNLFLQYETVSITDAEKVKKNEKDESTIKYKYEQNKEFHKA